MLLAVIMCAPLTAAAQGGAKKKMVCWTESSGRRACGDAIPPEYAKSEQKVIDSRGRVVKTVPAELTPAQREAQRKADERAAVQKRAADQQASYDRALLATYTRPEELAALRDDRLATLDATINLNQKALLRDDESLGAMRQRLPAAGEPVPPRLAEQIATFEKTQAENRAQIAELRRKRETVCASFTRDIRRFQELKSGEVSFVSPCPAADTTVPGADQDALLAEARRLFEGFSALASSRHPELFELYDEDAVIRYAYQSGTGKSETAELSRDDYRSEMLADWKKSAPGAAAAEFSGLSFEPLDKGRVRISGERTAAPGQAASKFYLVARPGGSGHWRIVEQWSEARF